MFGKILIYGTLFFGLESIVLGQSLILNNPWPGSDYNAKVLYGSYIEPPKTLDPAKSYEATEHSFIAQIVEPLLEYDYFARPYKLVPLIASEMPDLKYFDASGHELSSPFDGELAYTHYKIHIKSGIYYQPHPAFAKNDYGDYLYYPLADRYLKQHKIRKLFDFKETNTRELIVDDYIYQIKRLASPHVASSIHSLMGQYILGFNEFSNQVPTKNAAGGYIDLRSFPMAGLEKIDDYNFNIKIIGQYPQFLFWLAMCFFTPMPWEVERFYSQAGMEQLDLTLNTYPIGTGPFMISENNPNSKIILKKNPNYRLDRIPESHDPADRAAGYLKHAGLRIPMIDEAVFVLEKESIPRWSKFLQGYYDFSTINADNFDEAIQITPSGDLSLSPSLDKKNIRLTKMIEAKLFYLGFNMLDPIVGGSTQAARKLRQAISIAVNYDEYVSIFLNGRGKAAQGPLPPGIFGYREGKEGMNPTVYFWNGKEIQRRPIDDAKRLMTEAGYPNGINSKTHRPLMLYYDVASTGGPDDKAQLVWMRKQFAKIGIDLNIRSTQYNQFQDKIRRGSFQIFNWGWSADYPDPENFLFLLSSAQGKLHHGGENATNYESPVFDDLFNQMKSRPNDEERLRLIDKMIALLRDDCPWVWGIQNETITLSQDWLAPIKYNSISLNTLKYSVLDLNLRHAKQNQWNKPLFWPILGFILIVLSIIAFLGWSYRQTQISSAPRLS